MLGKFKANDNIIFYYISKKNQTYKECTLQMDIYVANLQNKPVKLPLKKFFQRISMIKTVGNFGIYLLENETEKYIGSFIS